MRITICAYDAPGNIDGPTAWLKRLLPFLRDNGVTARILIIGANNKNLPFMNEMNGQGFECVLIPWDLFLEEKIKIILDDLQNHPPDVFVPNYFPSACYAARWAKKAGIPSLVILHNDNEMHHALVDEFAAGDTENKVTAVIAVSQFIRKKIEEKNVVDVIVDAITYGAPIPSRVSSWKEGDNLKLIYAGRLAEHQKRISDVTLALCEVAREIPGTECVIYGSGNALESVLNIIKEKGAGLPVRYGGVLDSSKVQDHFLENHVFVLLSDYEGLPISLMEAMAAGLVPVCTDIRSGVGEVIKQGYNGFLVADRQDSFKQVIRKLKTNPSEWSDCANAARQTIVDQFSQEVCNRKWLALLRKLAAMNTRKGQIEMPATAVLQQISVRDEFKSFDNRMGSAWSIPFYKLKKRIGRLKRSFFG